MSMNAIQQSAFGGPEVLQYGTAPKPEIATDEVLVRVHAVGINPPDWYLREGYKDLPPEWRPSVTFPVILGTDISGIVEAVGSNSKGLKVGDEVYSMVRFPEGSAGTSRAYAEYVTIPVSQVALKPKNLDHKHAAAAPMSLLTAWQFLIDVGDDRNPLQSKPHVPVALKGKKVVVNGASGGVGHFALQLAKLKGAHVIAIASEKHEQMLRNLGADEFMDRNNVVAEDSLHDVDLVVDSVGGPSTGRWLKTLKPGGALYPIFPLGFTGVEDAEKQGFTVSTVQVRSNGEQLAEAAKLLDDGTIKVVIDSDFALADARKAHERVAKGHIGGKIVLTVN